MIYTGNYKNCSESKNFVLVADNSKLDASFNGKYYQPLFPIQTFDKKDYRNSNNYLKEKAMTCFIKNYYYDTLLYLNTDLLLEHLGSSFILGDCEEEGEFSHRYIVASYLELLFGIEIPEVKIEKGKTKVLPKSEIRKKIDDILYEIVIEESKQMPLFKEKTMKLL